MIRKIKKEVRVVLLKKIFNTWIRPFRWRKALTLSAGRWRSVGKESVFYYIDGFIKDEAMLKIMDSFLSITAEDLPQDAETFSKQKIPYVEVDVLKCFDDILRNVLSGTAVFFVDGYDAAL